MPFTPNHIALTGGCNCGAIRYRIDVPSMSSRPLNPSDPTGEARLPMVATDSCNDCRRATGAVLPVFICVPAPMLTMRVRPVPPLGMPSAPSDVGSSSNVSTTITDRFEGDDDRSIASYALADDLIYPPVSSSTSYPLRIYKSSPDVSRAFCCLCGTSLSFSRKPMPAGFPNIFDVLLGTLDRESLEREELAPERHCWLSCRIPWVDRILLGGNLPRHPRSRLNEEWIQAT